MKGYSCYGYLTLWNWMRFTWAYSWNWCVILLWKFLNFVRILFSQKEHFIGWKLLWGIVLCVFNVLLPSFIFWRKNEGNFIYLCDLDEWSYTAIWYGHTCLPKCISKTGMLQKQFILSIDVKHTWVSWFVHCFWQCFCLELTFSSKWPCIGSWIFGDVYI